VIEILVDGLDHPEGVCWDPGAGSVRAVQNGFTFPNFPAFAPDGTLYVSDSGSRGANDGRVLRLSADAELEVFSAVLTDFPNGCAVTADGRYLWIVESRNYPTRWAADA
jgi:sugar lactone lactonase YvrE